MGNPKLVVFDIDGTLTNTNKVDTLCYVRSIVEEFEIDAIDERWETYKNVTDSGIFEEIFVRAFSRPPTESETRRHITRLENLFREYHSQNPGLFQEVGGAREILQILKNHPQWRIGIATGAWRESAQFKLKSAGIDYEGTPMVTGSEARTREGVIRECIDESKRHYGVNHFERIVSVGDAIWDLKTANKMGIPFIGVMVAGKKDAFAKCSALSDYTNQEEFMNYLETAGVPDLP